nr:MAG TPA: hypothetical protein [Bacteriophage sp.]
MVSPINFTLIVLSESHEYFRIRLNVSNDFSSTINNKAPEDLALKT